MTIPAPIGMLRLFCADEEADDAIERGDHLPSNEKEDDDIAAVLEAVLLLRGSTSQDSQRTTWAALLPRALPQVLQPQLVKVFCLRRHQCGSGVAPMAADKG